MGTDLFTRFGCDLAAKKIVVVKSSQHFHAVVFEGRVKRVIYAAAPGAVTHDLRTLPTARSAGRSGRWTRDPPGLLTRPLLLTALDETTAHADEPSSPAPALAGAALLGAAPCPPRADQDAQFVAHADVKILDPTFTTAYISRNFGYMVYDTLSRQDEKGQPQPQMVDKYTTSKDGLAWTFTLRPGLKFSDGNAVTSADVVASMQRWASNDSFGRAMTATPGRMEGGRRQDIHADPKEPFGMVLEGMAKPSGFPPVVMPERMAKLPTTSPLTEVMGSGPFLFKRDEWVPGNKAVFVRNPNYVARSDAPSGAGRQQEAALRPHRVALPARLPTAPSPP